MKDIQEKVNKLIKKYERRFSKKGNISSEK